LEARLGTSNVRVLDVRVAATPSDARGPRPRSGGNVELRPFAYLGGPTRWHPSRERHPDRRGPSSAYVSSHIPGSVPLDVRAALFDDAGELVSAPELAMVMSALGVGDGHTVVLVDEGRPE